jgi:hypothetical protein
MTCWGKDPDRPYFSSRYALVLGSRARSVAKGDPGAILTRRKQRARTVRTTGIEERMRRRRKEIMEEVGYDCKGLVGKCRGRSGYELWITPQWLRDAIVRKKVELLTTGTSMIFR